MRPAAGRQTVHPRVRGDHAVLRRGRGYHYGSSPRSRGPHQRAPDLLDDARFIPAFAGTTRSGSAGRPGSSVHPRVRGDHDASATFWTVDNGSSPRSRGPQAQVSEGRSHRRFIPAFAGTTAHDARYPRRSAVHPRVRGDHVGVGHAAGLQPGSSPRSRGPQLIALLRVAPARFIPAFAGTTSASN